MKNIKYFVLPLIILNLFGWVVLLDNMCKNRVIIEFVYK
mgnify:CR=1 FL=1